MSMTFPKTTHPIALLADINGNNLLFLILNTLVMTSIDHCFFCKYAKLTCLVIQLYYFAGDRMQLHYYTV